jgi:TPR repeat protein
MTEKNKAGLWDRTKKEKHGRALEGSAKNYDLKAFRLKEKAAEQGDAESQKFIANQYYKGEGVVQNYKEAAKWYKKAAEQGNVDAQKFIANQCYREAVRWYKKAADQGDARAQKFIANQYYQGGGVVQSYKEAAKWYKKAADQGDVDAQTMLDKIAGSAKEDCDQTKKYSKKVNDREAFKLHKKAAEQGDAEAQFSLGWWYYREQEVVSNYNEAVRWFRKAAEQDYPEAQKMLDEIHHGSWVAESVDEGSAQEDYDRSVAYYKKGNYREAIKWLRKSSEQGFVEAQYNLGAMYANGKGVIQSYEEAFKWYRKSSEQGFAEAQCNLGTMYYEGQGVPQDYKEAFKWMKKAAEQDHAEAQCNLGTMYGTVKSDHEEALKWYKKAAEQGHTPGQERFDELSDILGEECESDESCQPSQFILDEENALCDFVEKANHTEHIFANIINDLNDAIEVSVSDWPPLTLMAYGYAHRTAAAALYLQGLMVKDQYVEVKDVFIGLQIKTGGTAPFQEQAFAESVKFVKGYNPSLTKSTIKGIVQIAEGCEIPHGVSVSDDELLRRVRTVTSAPEDSEIDLITKAVLETIPNEEIALSFVLEELDGAQYGNEDAKKFVKDCGFLRDEYEGEIKSSSPEVDGPYGPQQTLTRLIIGLPKSIDERARMRIEVVKRIINAFKLDE